MKSVLLIRHAKSSWSNASGNDFDRPLNERGHLAAPEMAQRLLHRQVPIDALLSSTAKRAWSTAAYFAAAYEIPESSIIRVPLLYHAALPVFYEVIARANDAFNTIALVSHNPGITEMANSLTPTRVDDMPTCAIFAVQAPVVQWKDFEQAAKQYWFFDYPRANP